MSGKVFGREKRRKNAPILLYCKAGSVSTPRVVGSARPLEGNVASIVECSSLKMNKHLPKNFHAYVLHIFHRSTHDHRMAEMERDLWRSSSLSPCSKQNHLVHIAHDCVQLGFNISMGGKSTASKSNLCPFNQTTEGLALSSLFLPIRYL